MPDPCNQLKTEYVEPFVEKGQIRGLKGPNIWERSLFPLRLVFSKKSKNIPYNCLNPRVVTELMNLRKNWTAFRSNSTGLLQGDELKANLQVFGSEWFKEYALPFTLGLFLMMGLSTLGIAAFGPVGGFFLLLLGLGVYLGWINMTMNVVRPGELGKLLPFLRLEQADRAYLESVDWISKLDLDYDQKCELLGTLNHLVQLDYDLQKSLANDKAKQSPIDVRHDLTYLRERVGESQNEVLKDAYAEVLDYAEKRVIAEQRMAEETELVLVQKMLLLEKLVAIRNILAGWTRTAPQRLNIEVDESYIRALHEVNELKQDQR